MIRQFLLTDQVGTLRAVADTSGNIVKRIDYDSFGNIITDSNPGFAVPFGFAGGLHDRDAGLVRFGARDYDPAIGRFVAKDPIDFAGGDTNLYNYVMNDPINLTDPSGLTSIQEYWAKIETFAKPYTVGGGLLVTGAAVGTTGAAATIAGFSSIPATGLGGVAVGAAGIVVTAAGVSMGTLGLDVYADELRNRLGLPAWFDVLKDFELLGGHHPKAAEGGNCPGGK